MNLLILSPGRRCEIIKNFKTQLNKRNQKVIAVDMDKYAPALYFADKFYVVKKNFDNLETYIEEIIKICQKENAGFLMTLIDPELELLSGYRDRFSENHIQLILSDDRHIKITLDKYLFYLEYRNNMHLPKTFRTYDEAIREVNAGSISFPIMAKPINGSASLGIQKINSFPEMEFYKSRNDYIYQEYLRGKEIGIDLYFDLITGEIVSVFMKEKIAMRSGETDKAISIFRKDLLKEIIKLEEDRGGYRGPVDVDMFISQDNKIFILEVNPRFGGGYPLAHYCGVDFIELIVNNLNGIQNKAKIGGYKLDTVMMKCNKLIFKTGADIYEE